MILACRNLFEMFELLGLIFLFSIEVVVLICRFLHTQYMFLHSNTWVIIMLHNNKIEIKTN
jgi:hypothetical protein